MNRPLVRCRTAPARRPGPPCRYVVPGYGFPMSTMVLRCSVPECPGSVRYDGPRTALGAARPAPRSMAEQTTSDDVVYLRCDGTTGHVRGYRIPREERG